jgi:hypothetical protein
LQVAGLLWEKSTAGWWLISQANRAMVTSVVVHCAVAVWQLVISCRRRLLQLRRPVDAGVRCRFRTGLIRAHEWLWTDGRTRRAIGAGVVARQTHSPLYLGRWHDRIGRAVCGGDRTSISCHESEEWRDVVKCARIRVTHGSSHISRTLAWINI